MNLSYFSNPKRFKSLVKWLMPVLGIIGLVTLIWGLYGALISSPADYQQGEYVRLMYIHVPAAWLGMGIYASMFVASLLGFIWRHRLAELYCVAAAPVGALFTFICLVTGSLWGYPTWGTYWVWDARLTSVLILFFIYMGHMALVHNIDNKIMAHKMAAVLTILGGINLPIIKFSVEWWNTLHQPASLTSFKRISEPAIHQSMLTPLLFMAVGLACWAGVMVLLNMNIELNRFERER